MPKNPDICPTFIPQADKITALIEQYGKTLKIFEVEGTPALAQELDRLKAEILALKEDINKTLEPLGYDLDNPPTTLESPDEIDAKLKALGSPAVLDRTIEDGIFSFSIDAITAEKLRTPESAKKAFEEADGGSASNPWDGFFDTKVDEWEPLTKTTLDTCIVSHGATTQAQRRDLVIHMESLGYRTPTRTELLALAITRPDINKIPDRYFTTLKEYSLDGNLRAPCFGLDGDGRGLSAGNVSNVWNEYSRVLFVRK